MTTSRDFDQKSEQKNPSGAGSFSQADIDKAIALSLGLATQEEKTVVETKDVPAFTDDNTVDQVANQFGLLITPFQKLVNTKPTSDNALELLTSYDKFAKDFFELENILKALFQDQKTASLLRIILNAQAGLQNQLKKIQTFFPGEYLIYKTSLETASTPNQEDKTSALETKPDPSFDRELFDSIAQKFYLSAPIFQRIIVTTPTVDNAIELFSEIDKTLKELLPLKDFLKTVGEDYVTLRLLSIAERSILGLQVKFEEVKSLFSEQYSVYKESLQTIDKEESENNEYDSDEEAAIKLSLSIAKEADELRHTALKNQSFLDFNINEAFDGSGTPEVKEAKVNEIESESDNDEENDEDNDELRQAMAMSQQGQTGTENNEEPTSPKRLTAASPARLGFLARSNSAPTATQDPTQETQLTNSPK